MVRKLAFDEHKCIANLLEDTPDNVQSLHFLSALGRGTVYIDGDINSPESFLIQGAYTPGEPKAYRDNPESILEILKVVDGWSCVLVNEPIGRKMGELISKEFGCKIRYFGDSVYSLTKPVKVFKNKYVRLLTLDDAHLLKQAPKDLQGAGFSSIEEMLTKGVVAGAIVDDELVSIAHTFAITPKHADIGTYTHEDYRGRGFSTAASSLVAKALQARGLIPVWSTGEDTLASQKIAEKLGFKEVHRNVFVIKN